MDRKKIFQTIKNETRFDVARASGPGGQNVNKRSTKVIGLWNFSVSRAISDQEKKLISQALKNRLSLGRVLIVTSQASRSQQENKKRVLELMATLVTRALSVPTERVPTAIPPAKKEKRITLKKKHSKKKSLRRVSNAE